MDAASSYEIEFWYWTGSIMDFNVADKWHEASFTFALASTKALLLVKQRGWVGDLKNNSTQFKAIIESVWLNYPVVHFSWCRRGR